MQGRESFVPGQAGIKDVCMCVWERCAGDKKQDLNSFVEPWRKISRQSRAVGEHQQDLLKGEEKECTQAMPQHHLAWDVSDAAASKQAGHHQVANSVRLPQKNVRSAAATPTAMKS